MLRICPLRFPCEYCLVGYTLALLVAGGPGHRVSLSTLLCHVDVRLTISSGTVVTSRWMFCPFTSDLVTVSGLLHTGVCAKYTGDQPVNRFVGTANEAQRTRVTEVARCVPQLSKLKAVLAMRLDVAMSIV